MLRLGSLLLAVSVQALPVQADPVSRIPRRCAVDTTADVAWMYARNVLLRSLLSAFAAAICCEVLEHVDDPGSLLSALARRVDARAPAFLSTVANMEAEDHVYLFRDLAHIRSTIIDGGFTIDTEQPLALAGAEGLTPLPLNYSAIARAAAPEPA